jgi:hypothetical protein
MLSVYFAVGGGSTVGKMSKWIQRDVVVVNARLSRESRRNQGTLPSFVLWTGALFRVLQRTPKRYGALSEWPSFLSQPQEISVIYLGR